MVTPLDQDLNLDQEGLERLVEHLIKGGVHGIFILGTTGEAPNLPYSVRAELIERTCKLVGSRVPIIVGITDTSYHDALRMAAKAYASGALAVVAAPPYYFQVGQADLLHYFKRMASDSPLPLFLYNAPLNTRLWIDVPTAVEAAAEPNIVGLKDSGLNMGYFHAVREGVRSRPDFSLLVGPDDLLAEAVLLGAHGGMAGGSNVNPRLFVDLYEAAVANNMNRVATLHQQAIQFDNAVYRATEDPHNPLRALKAALSIMGICGEAMTPPLRPISTRERETIAQYLRGVESTSAAYPSR
ncbi:MAG: 4-hydroxy-tetrahydrodipicolinate synthase [Acidobacteriaceae bacterium]|jgi:4-hydroxy-tetrahydrodipicolinate synthase|nr:4-hydroxy-tetrahydrodipicolinate synthase [Acidobacteriaceae bacterium]MEA2540983.1 4-hydroxy-tetrahydrodipicolinate synthase [Acidobacteriaceae bacterium]